jgi:two-component system response regulator YesN
LAWALQKFILGNNRLIDSGQYTGEAHTNGFISPDMNKELLIHLRMNDLASLETKLIDIFEQIRNQRLSVEYTYVVCLGLVSLCISQVFEKGHPIEHCFGEDFFPYSEIMKQESIEDARQWIMDLFQKAVHYSIQHKPTKSNKIAALAKLYIEQYYPNPDFQLEEVAQHLYVNSSYLRALFKKEVGMTIMEYVTHYRMLKAKEMLSQGNNKIVEISERIGYHDPAYFSRCFKKFYGFPPREYQNINN